MFQRNSSVGSSEIERVFNDLRSKPLDQKQKPADDLRNIFQRNQEQSKEIFTRLQKFIKSSDLGEKNSGLIAIERLADVVPETHIIHFVNEFIYTIFYQLESNSDYTILKRIAELFGKLVSLGGTKVAQLVEGQVEKALGWLNIESKKLAALLALKELLVQAPYTTFNRIFGNDETFFQIWGNVRDKMQYVKECALNFFEESIKQISQREKNIQQEWMLHIYMELKKSFSSGDSDIVYGNIQTLKSLLTYSSKEIFINQMVELGEYILQFRNDKNMQVQRSVIETIPILAYYSTGVFITKFLKQSIQFLLQHTRNTKSNKDKSLCYETITNIFTPIDDSFIKEQLKMVMKHIVEDIERKHKPFIPEILKCLEILTLKFRKKIQECVDIQYLVDQILLNGIQEQTMNYLQTLSTLDIPQLKDYIQIKLLCTISMILAGRYFAFPVKSELDITKVNGFQSLMLREYNSNNEFRSTEYISQALHAISSYDFDEYNESLGVFVIENALQYLENEKPIIRRAAAKAGCLLSIKHSRTHGLYSITMNIIDEILEKFLSLALGDPDITVRQTMLESLNENFDTFLNHPKNLRLLFLCMNDTAIKVKQLALRVLCRLAEKTPPLINTYLKKILFEIISSLENQSSAESEKIENLMLLLSLIRYGGLLVTPHGENILKTLLNMLKKEQISNNLIPHILNCIGPLAQKVNKIFVPYLVELFPFLLSSMQDMSYSFKREVAVKAMKKIVRGAGYVIIPYFKYPQLMQVIFNLLRLETRQEVRKNLFKLLGVLGAIDSYVYRKINQNLKVTSEEDEIKEFEFIDQMYITNSIKATNRYLEQTPEPLLKFYSDLFVISNFDNTEKRFFPSQLLQNVSANNKMQIIYSKLNDINNIYKSDNNNNNNNNDNNNNNSNNNNNNKLITSDSEIEVLLNSPTIINLRDLDFFSTFTLKALLKILCNKSLLHYHDMAIDSLMYIVLTLKTRTSHFLYLLIPVFIKLAQDQYYQFFEKVMYNLDRLIQQCDTHFKQEFLQPVLECSLKYIDNPKVQIKCFDILLQLTYLCKLHIRPYVEIIVQHLNAIINLQPQNNEILRRGLAIYTALEENLDVHLHLVLPTLCELLNNINVDFNFKKEIIKLFSVLVKSCPTTIQYSSLIVQNLLLYLEQTQQDSNEAMNCIVQMLQKYKQNFAVYLPQIQAKVSKLKIQHKEYNKCIEILLNQGNIEDVSSYLEIMNSNSINSNNNNEHNITPRTRNSIYPSSSNEQLSQNITMRPFEGETIKNYFDTSSKTLKEEWIEWMRKSSVELLQQSPNPILYSCASFAEMYTHIARELYNVAFASVWNLLQDKQKEFIIKMLYNAISSQTTPISILQIILNLAEFLSHDKEEFQLEKGTLADLAERCSAYAKALYYREKEFEVSPQSSIESLFSIYTQLGQPEAANGILAYAQQNLDIQLKTHWYESLQRWEEALNEYRLKQLQEPNSDEYFVPKVRCFSALSDWESVLQQVNTLYEKRLEEYEKKRQVAIMAASATLHLGVWDKMEKYTENIQENTFEKKFYQAIISLQKNKLQEAKVLVNAARETLEGKIDSLMLESYSRAYENIIKLQELCELDEIISYKKKVEQTKKQYGNDIECSKELNRLKVNLKEMWYDRLTGCKQKVYVWERILSVRSLLFSMQENMDQWLDYINLSRRTGKKQVAKRTIDKLKLEINTLPKNEFDYPAIVVLTSYQCDYDMGVGRENETMQKISDYLVDPQLQIDNRVRSRYLLKFGKWYLEQQEVRNQTTIEKGISYFEMSINYNNKSHKAWHSYAMLNYEAASELIKQSQQETKLFYNFIHNAVLGFVKTISIGSGKYSETFQDTLRLLSIWFNYGNYHIVKEELRNSFGIIDIICWIEVVPQLIARIDTTNKSIQDLILQLLIHISKHHPQSLIYPLTVASKSKSTVRKDAAIKIFEDMKVHSPLLVEQASLIADELNRAAILLKEQWAEGIEEACKMFFVDKNIDNMIRVLKQLHDTMKSKPQTHSEMSFYQTYSKDLNEAYSYLNRFVDTKDELCLNQAWDTYYIVFRRISNQLGFLNSLNLQNVAPKLLSITNCQVSVPGLYKLNKPVVRILSFAPKLPVLSSKQHPRKLFIMGDDNKEYHFLLKGHEDLRQDERVMQLFSLVNRLLAKDPETEHKDLYITRYAVIPLSQNTGLLGWVQNCDTLQQLIREYRDNSKIIQSTEANLIKNMCPAFENVCLAHKVEIFREVLENTKGEDLQKVLWLKSPNSEVWLERRTNYTLSLATMSMVGYLLGLGDRHPSNLMLQRYTGKIVHIDFGDCFEVAMKREKFPERVPFRLTRMLVKALEASGIEGTFRHTCEIVMRVLRENRESLMAVLEAFVYDPLLNWRLLTASDAMKNENSPEIKSQSVQIKSNTVGSVAISRTVNIAQQSYKNLFENAVQGASPKRKEDRHREIQAVYGEEGILPPSELLNQKALQVIDRIKKKLVGRDFKDHESLLVTEQVDRLIRQATSLENICQAYIGWCPYW